MQHLNLPSRIVMPIGTELLAHFRSVTKTPSLLALGCMFCRVNNKYKL